MLTICLSEVWHPGNDTLFLIYMLAHLAEIVGVGNNWVDCTASSLSDSEEYMD